MTLSTQEIQSMKPLYIPREGNFNFYIDPKLKNAVWWVAKPNSGCHSGIFGNYKYFTNWLREELRKDPTIDGRFTATCFGLLETN